MAKKWKWLSGTYKFLNIIVIVGLLLSYLAPFIDPRTFWPMAFMGLSFIFWLLSAFIMLLWGILLRNRQVLFLFAALVLGTPFILRTFTYNGSKTGSADFTIASFNTKAFGHDATIANDLNKLMEENQIDIMVFLEWRRGLFEANKKRYPHIKTFKHGINSGVQLVSRFPILRSGKITLEKSFSDATWADVKLHNQVIRIYLLHLESNLLKPNDYRKIKELSLDSSYKANAEGIMVKIKNAAKKRASQVEIIREHMANSEHPVFICADLNDTPTSFAYQQLKKGRKDAFVEAGSGREATFVKPFPFLRIDYILFNPSFTCVKYNSIRQHFSDHKLIFAAFNKPNTTN